MATLRYILDEIERISDGDDSICVVINTPLLHSGTSGIELSLHQFREKCNTIWKDRLDIQIGPISWHSDDPDAYLSVSGKYGTPLIYVPMEMGLKHKKHPYEHTEREETSLLKYSDDKYLDAQIELDLKAVEYHVEESLKKIKNIRNNSNTQSLRDDLIRLSADLFSAGYDCNDIKRRLYRDE